MYLERTSATSVILALSLVLAGCNSEPKIEAKTIEFYLEHDAERLEMLQKCDVMDGAITNADCINATEADFKLQQQKTHKQLKGLFSKKKPAQ